MANLLQNQVFAPLFDKPLFHSDIRVEAHDFVSREFANHALQWRAGVPDATMYKAEFNQINIYALRYGPEIEVKAHPFDNFVLVHTSLHGGMEVDCDGSKLWIKEGSTAVLAPRKKLHMHWSRKSQQLIFKIPLSLLNAAGGSFDRAGACLHPAFLLPPALNRQWECLVQAIAGAIPQAANVDISPYWVNELERAVGTFILTHKPTQALPVFEGQRNAGLDTFGDQQTIEKLVSYIDKHLSGPISLQDFTSVTGLSIRAVNDLCQRHFGMTPMELVRNRRLDAVHRMLLLDPHASVTETAMNCGFGHLGRFSAYYEARFNQLPRDTQRSTRGT